MRIIEYFQKKKKIKSIKIQYATLIKELNLFNSLGEYPEELQLKFIEYGYELHFDISGIKEFIALEKKLDFIKDCFRAYNVKVSNDRGKVILTVYESELKIKEFIRSEIGAYKLLLGYNYEGIISTDMKISPHLLISGLSGQGKTGQLRVLTANLIGQADIYLINCFKNDFRGFKGVQFINGNENILNFLAEFKEKQFKEHKKPIYLIFDEMMTLSEDKKIQKLIKEFLCVCRHYNCFIIALLQVCRSEDFKAKTFFNSRVSFKQMDRSSYGVALGSTGEMEELKKREFYSKGSNGLEKGTTYNLDY
ncbi:MAG: hypothetical protein ACRC41_05070 [Sarcina sp.]